MDGKDKIKRKINEFSTCIFQHLHLQLKHFEYDIQQDAMVQINDRHEFPFGIVLDEILDTSADRSPPWVYKLHGVLVHSGDLHGGHYFALIKPNCETC